MRQRSKERNEELKSLDKLGLRAEQEKGIGHRLERTMWSVFPFSVPLFIDRIFSFW